MKEFFSKCDQISRKLKNWSHILKKSITENFFFFAVLVALKNHHLLKVNRKNCSIGETKKQHKRLTKEMLNEHIIECKCYM